MCLAKEGRQDSLEDDKDDDIETGALEQKDSTTSLGAAGDWDESAHPRGQPQNAGQFVKKGQGRSGVEDVSEGLRIHHKGKKYEAKDDTLDKVSGPSIKKLFDKHRYNVTVSTRGAGTKSTEYYEYFARQLNERLNEIPDEVVATVR